MFDFDNLPPADPMSGIRHERDRLLKLCDWTQMPDVLMSEQRRAAFLAYRQALRDIPTTFTAPEDVVWPVHPDVA